MKKLTFLLVACAVTMMSFAAGGNITYELNGGVTNSDGWKDKADMLVSLNLDYNTQYNVTSGTWVTWETLDVILKNGDPVTRIPTFATKMYDLMATPKWQWLRDYLVATVAAQKTGGNKASVGTTPLDILEQSTAAEAYWRYNVSAFFTNKQRTGWPASADYTVAGQAAAFMGTWKHGFAGPTTYAGTEAVVLPEPYKENDAFLGWYDNNSFTGTKIKSIPVGAEGDKAFYARWAGYTIPTCAAIQALNEGASTKARGVVTFKEGTTAYIQDVWGGLKVEFSATSDIAVGDEVIVSGNVASLSTYKIITAATVETKEESTLPTLQTMALTALKANLASYMFEYVYLEGLTIKAKDGNNITVSDDDNNTIKLVTTTTLPVSTKINIKCVVSYDTEGYVIAEASKVTAAPVPRLDPSTYAAHEDGKYTLTNKWLVSNKLDNLSANPIHSAAQMVRGMVAKDGKMYFIDRNLKQLTIVDGATGKKLTPVKFASNIFKYMDGEVEKDAGTLTFNDIKVDNAGNVLIGNCITSNAQPFQIWKINLADGTGTLVLQDILKNNTNFEAPATVRFDAFGVWGDIDGDAIIMAASASAMEAYKWTFKNGVLESSEVVIIDTSEKGTFITGLTNPGTAPQIFPLDQDYFYLDGNATLPTLIDMEGNVVDGFYNVPKEVEDWAVGTGNKAGHNGLIEFEVAGEHFFLIASGNTLATPPSSFRLFKWKDANKEFKDIKSLWTLPADGMGAASNPYRTAVPSVEVNKVTNTATLYLYTGENGYGVYEFKVNVADGVSKVNDNTIKIGVNERTLSFEEPMASVAIYSVSGQLQVKANNVSSVKIANQGIYLVKVKTTDGINEIHKVIVK
ncbi:hypothetical protein MASR2M117_02880 [Paludibacter sp.]